MGLLRNGILKQPPFAQRTFEKSAPSSTAFTTPHTAHCQFQHSKRSSHPATSKQESNRTMQNFAEIDWTTDSGTDSESEQGVVEEGGGEVMEQQPQATEPNREVEWIEGRRSKPILLYEGELPMSCTGHAPSVSPSLDLP